MSFARFVYWLVLLFFPLCLAFGQKNPFQIIRQATKPDTAIHRKSDTAAVRPTNPFALRKPTYFAVNIHTDGSNARTFPKLIPDIPTGRLKASDIKPLLFWTLLFLTFLLAIAMNLNRSVTNQLSRSLFNVNFLNLLYRERKYDTQFIYFLLYGLYFIGLSIFVYIATNLFWGLKHPLYLLWFSLLIVAVYTVRHLSLKALGWVFNMSMEAGLYSFSIILFGSLTAVFLIPVDFVISFVDTAFAKSIVRLTTLILIVLYLYRQFRELIRFYILWSARPFHFLLYLCTCEIAPLILLYRFICSQGIWG